MGRGNDAIAPQDASLKPKCLKIEELHLKQHSHSMFLGAILAISTLLAGDAFAETRTSVHPDLRGIWAMESCMGNDAGFLVMRGTMLMMIEGGDATAQRLVTDQIPEENGWIKSQFEDDVDPLFLRRVAGYPDTLEFAGPAADSGDNSMTMGPGPNPDPLLWEMWQLDSCPALPLGPQALYGELLAVLDGIDDAETACIGGPEECATALFAIADVHPDGVLTVAEISRMLRVALQIGAIEQGNGAADVQIGMIAASFPLAPILAKALVSSFDYDGDNALSLDEIMQDRVVLPSSDMSALLAQAEVRVSEMMTTLETRGSDLGRLLMMLR